MPCLLGSGIKQLTHESVSWTAEVHAISL